MKVVIFGLTMSSSWGNGHATIWRALARALAKRGHRVVFFERDVQYYSANRDFPGAPWLDLVLYDDWEGIMKRAQRELIDADVGMVTSYCPDGKRASELLLSSKAGVKCFYDLDTPVTLSNLNEGREVDYLPDRGLGSFDIVLSYTGGRALDELKIVLGAKKTAPLYGSVDPQTHGPAGKARDYAADLSYLGTFAEDRQRSLMELFIEPARRLPEKRFVLGGSLYPKDFPWTRNIYFVWHVPPPLHPSFYSSARWSLNVTRAAMASMGWCPSGRLFEAAACGSPVLSDYWEGIDEFLSPGTEIVIVRGSEEVADALAMDEAERMSIARAARERVLEEHTASVRAAEFERMMECALERKEEVCGG